MWIVAGIAIGVALRHYGPRLYEAAGGAVMAWLRRK